ncbi:chemotaxis protein CheD [Faecalicatena contorta]|uniref:Probable chemoreceptor glutamine deamidase CheD n=1 Tax=Faecalicatena contorta TaxID=39482 RepID=A0A316AQV1_9FIRM|nr:chemotaxis protein CheD [Faecalicatena contorta]PWJ52457.1 chemotaxis protein CheD [Faecalicatena contorta]SUQ12735.1 chemotaxis protein CheD [Faecalicatena contorta]
MNKEVTVGIADMKIVRQEGTLITYALGSCIGISFYDPMIKLTALLHIMLPKCSNPSDTQIFKFADTGIQETLRRMSVFGGVKSRYICKIAGGARMFEVLGSSSLANIGEKNIESVRNILLKEQISLTRQDVGSNYARTMRVAAETGTVSIHTYGKQDIIM